VVQETAVRKQESHHVSIRNMRKGLIKGLIISGFRLVKVRDGGLKGYGYWEGALLGASARGLC
jgi:hypothetical protein